MSEGEVLRVESRRAARSKRAQRIQHVVAALLLIGTGYGHLNGPHHGSLILPALEIAAGLLLIATAVRERLQKDQGHGARVGWLEIAGAVMAFVEALSRVSERHHLSFKIVSFLPPLVLLLLGIFEMQIATFRNLRADDDALVTRLSKWRRRRFVWADMRAFRVDGWRVTFERKDGKTQTLSLRDVKERDAALAWTAAQLEKRGIARRSAFQQLPGGEGQTGQRQADQ
jgi:hypothetical protein